MNRSQSWIERLRGYVLVEIQGKHLEQLINVMAEKRMSLWDVRRSGESTVQLYITIRDFFRLRPLLKKTGSRVHVVKRFGFPFLLDKLGKRKFFAMGLAGFLAGLYVLSSIVWQVRVEGNEKISTEQILQAAQKAGIYQLQWKFRLQEPEDLSRVIQSQLPGTAWIGVEIQGTHVLIKLVEATIPEQKPLQSPRHLVAAKNALITTIIAEKGRPVAKPNTYVRKGDVLISGLLGDEENQLPVVAEGKIKGIVWYSPKVEVPLVRQYKVYTGESKKRFYLVFGSRALQLSGYGKLAFEAYETEQHRKALRWRDWVLPFGWIHEKVMETRIAEHPIDAEEAKAVGLEQAKAEILAQSGEGSRIVSEKILHEQAENGKVYIEVHLEVEESIAAEQPVVLEEQAPEPSQAQEQGKTQ